MAYLGEEIKKLGFGLMRLPEKNDGETDVEQTKEMVDMFMDAGFTYFDTAWAYDDSEAVIKEALVDRYPRESFLLATKLAVWVGCKTREEAIKQLDESLQNTGAGYFDFYLLHDVGEERTKMNEKFKLWDFFAEKKKEGILKHIGFSFHSTADELDEVLTKHPEMEFVQLQINYADWENPAIQSRACYEVARKHGKPVIIMEPVRGGELANPPKKVEDILKSAEPDSSNASWAIRFAADLEGVITVLSGMSNVEQMADNLSYMKDFTHLTDAQRDTLEKARLELMSIPSIPCTACKYCAKVCPMNIGIAGSFKAMNIELIYGETEDAKDEEIDAVVDKGLKRANECIKCGKCEKVCPQHIHIRDELERVAKALID